MMIVTIAALQSDQRSGEVIMSPAYFEWRAILVTVGRPAILKR